MSRAAFLKEMMQIQNHAGIYDKYPSYRNQAVDLLCFGKKAITYV